MSMLLFCSWCCGSLPCYCFVVGVVAHVHVAVLLLVLWLLFMLQFCAIVVGYHNTDSVVAEIEQK